ncbi:MAG: hypothetical protein ACE37N_13620 [Pseudohongiellaceae bacterium]
MDTPGGALRLRALFVAAAATLLGLPAATLPGMSSPMRFVRRPPRFPLATVPRIDGQVMDDEAWRTVAPSVGFTQVQPHYRYF